MVDKAHAQIKGDGILVCENLFLNYGSKTILSDININVPRGSVVGIVGANGAGKSTLLRCMAGLKQPQDGEVRLFGIPALAMSDAVRERIGFVAQTPDLFSWMTVEDHIRFIGQAYPQWDDDRAYQLTTRLSLPLRRQVSQLSGGDQQKLAVILAMSHNPELVLLDEPVSHLDPMTRREFMGALFDKDQSLFSTNDAIGFRDDPIRQPTVVISSHLLSDLEPVVSHIAFMKSGRLQLFSKWEVILEKVRIVEKKDCSIPEQLCISSNPNQHIFDLSKVIASNQLNKQQKMALESHSRALNSLDDLFIALNPPFWN